MASFQPSLRNGEMVAFDSPIRRTARLFELKFVHSESQLRNHFRRNLDEEQKLQQMAAATGLDDKGLLRRLQEAGLQPETVGALPFFPLAMMAWASGSVTTAERQHAEQAIDSAGGSGNSDAIEQFRQWLRQKPSDQWWPLWEDYVRASSATREPDGSVPDGHAIWQLAKRIAIASGGVWGVGTICSAEQKILERIQQIYVLA